MRVRFLGTFQTISFTKDTVYDVMSIELGWHRIMTDDDKDCLFPPEHFEIIDYRDEVLLNESY